jgi:hypothetical protein
MPLGQVPQGSSGGGGNKTIKQYTSPISPQQQAALNYLQGAAGQNLGSYNSALAAIGAQRNALGGAYGAMSGAANREYGTAIKGINQDLMFGNQLRGQEQYRNVDLGRARALADYKNQFTTLGITNTDIMRRWLQATSGYHLDNRKTKLAYGTGMRETGSDAIARGARTAAGTLADFADVRATRDIGLDANRLNLEVTRGGLKTEGARAKQQFAAFKAQYGIDLKTFNSLAKTYGIQAAQAAAQAALAKERAGNARSSAGANAAASRASGLAGLAGAQQNAYNQYMQGQQGIMSQLLGFAG